jgi:hypothetical protein
MGMLRRVIEGISTATKVFPLIYYLQVQPERRIVVYPWELDNQLPFSECPGSKDNVLLMMIRGIHSAIKARGGGEAGKPTQPENEQLEKFLCHCIRTNRMKSITYLVENCEHTRTILSSSSRAFQMAIRYHRSIMLPIINFRHPSMKGNAALYASLVNENDYVVDHLLSLPVVRKTLRYNPMPRGIIHHRHNIYDLLYIERTVPITARLEWYWERRLKRRQYHGAIIQLLNRLVPTPMIVLGFTMGFEEAMAVSELSKQLNRREIEIPPSFMITMPDRL